MKIVGLTGGVASGKSTVTEYLREMGIDVIDCDAIVHDVQNNNKSLNKVMQKKFPNAYEHGVLNRKKLSDLVMADDNLLQEVESITLPYVRQEIVRQINGYKKEKKDMVVIDAPLLFEKNLDKICDASMCVYIDTEEQKRRFLLRPNMTEEKFDNIVKKQMTLIERKQRADYMLLSDSYDNLRSRLKTALNDIKGIESKPNKSLQDFIIRHKNIRQ